VALWRLFWIPDGLPASEGAYVKERPEELLALLRSVSHDSRCLIVGEDLGTIPEEVREGLIGSGFYSYRLAIFERDAEGRNRRPATYPRQALVSISTHDLPTLDGFWLGTDLDVKQALGRYPDEESSMADREGRKRDRTDLLHAIRAEGLLPPRLDPMHLPAEGDLDDLAVAAHSFLARASSALLLVNVDDLFGEREMQNLPGTIDEHPNWRRKCGTPLESWAHHPRAKRIATAIRQEGRGLRSA
jgi:4-alpha-glucanotransferase